MTQQAGPGPIGDELLALNALAYYLDGGGALDFRDGNAAHPRRDRPFTISFTVQEPERYARIWWRVMQASLGRSRPRG